MSNSEASNLTNQAFSKPAISKMVHFSSGANSTSSPATASPMPAMAAASGKNSSSKKPSLRIILGGLILVLLVVGSGAALYLSQTDQDVRQQAAGCNYWVGGGGAPEGSCDCRGGIPQQCSGGYWSAPGSACASACGGSGGGTSTPSPIASPVSGAGCAGGNCTSPPGGCIAIHHCDQLWDNGECTVLTPDVTTGTVNAQQEANRTCKCVQVDVLTGGNGSCQNGHINGDWSTLIGAAVVCPNSSANCGGTGGGPTPSPNPSNPPSSPDPSSPPPTSPNPSPITYFCNSNCTTDRQCKTADNNFFCSEGKCRLSTNPGSAQCQPPTGPMCLDIAMVDALTGAELTADPKLNDTVKFSCANVTGINHYAFRVIEPGGAIKTLTATGRVSEPYTISKSGKFFAQCQICTGEDDLSCNAFEALE